MKDRVNSQEIIATGITLFTLGFAVIGLARLAFSADAVSFLSSVKNADPIRGDCLKDALYHHGDDLQRLSRALGPLTEEQALALANLAAHMRIPPKGKKHQHILTRVIGAAMNMHKRSH